MPRADPIAITFWSLLLADDIDDGNLFRLNGFIMTKHCLFDYIKSNHQSVLSIKFLCHFCGIAWGSGVEQDRIEKKFLKFTQTTMME